ncbi:uncharacterized protein HD556DRAFT_1434916 [Suillus plorans]|uniref:Zn(2)-C6 fungal-type domain-containing protein n=1 Tax=Suillus plorans TaxID=116603 RepID=A0A9P7ABJ0_9AGAM|nr:uncharacterized protein HD556DRAFT_1434916 [Suillus plorans]KAG1785979.1 hypothetical protein HD556DRAFT_1434916 [Suillus plorans]
MQNGDHVRNDNGHSFSHPGLILPTQSVQNQIHELAKTLPPPRKQNTACDACRSRKVKCNRLPGEDKHCLSKNYPCTHFVQQATSEKKRSAAARRPRNISTSSRLASGTPISSRLSSSSPISEHNTPPWFKAAFGPWNSGRIQSYGGLSMQSTTPTLLHHLFAAPESDSTFMFKSRSSSGYAAWGDMASKLEDEAFRAEFALDLVEVYFQIVHTRLPLLNPLQFRARLNLQATQQRPVIAKQDEPLHPALIATVLAWGAKFSEHPLLVADRDRNGGQSLLAKALINRTRELAESLKVHRIPNTNHVVISLLIEPLQCQDPRLDNGNIDLIGAGFHGFWLTSGIRNLLGLQINHKSVMVLIKDPEARGTMIFAWWMACLSDAFSSFYYRRKPMLDDDDYDIDFYTADQNAQETTDPTAPSPREQLEGYYQAAHALARISRTIARQLWRPSTDQDGIPLDSVLSYISDLSKWRDAHLSKVGVPPNLEANWDFVSAVSACASDAQYHVTWVALFFAMDEFGIRDDAFTPSSINQVETAKRKVMEEALQASLRIAALKLDPAVMHVSCINAGNFLARLGRPEVFQCIKALEQYSYAYEETKEHAKEISREYDAALQKGPNNFHEMASAISPSSRAFPAEIMSVDALTNGNGKHHGNTVSPFL